MPGAIILWWALPLGLGATTTLVGCSRHLLPGQRLLAASRGRQWFDDSCHTEVVLVGGFLLQPKTDESPTGELARKVDQPASLLTGHLTQHLILARCRRPDGFTEH